MAIPLEEFLRRVDAIDWSRHEGAYGPSHELVPRAFRQLVEAQETDSDDWMDGMDVFSSHVWHQGDLGAVAPVAVPLLLALSRSANVASCDDLADLLDVYREDAERHAASGDARQRAVGEATLAALAVEVEPVALPPRRPPPRDTDEQMTAELERYAATIAGGSYTAQSHALGRSRYFLARAPSLVLHVCAAADRADVAARRRWLRARALRLTGDVAAARRELEALVEEWLRPAERGGVNQALSRRELLEALHEFERADVDELLRRIEQSGEPEILLPTGDSF